jgi:hypothetical protein
VLLPCRHIWINLPKLHSKLLLVRAEQLQYMGLQVLYTGSIAQGIAAAATLHRRGQTRLLADAMLLRHSMQTRFALSRMAIMHVVFNPRFSTAFCVVLLQPWWIYQEH